jgi:hypothetical protein
MKQFTFITRSDACGAAEMFAEYLVSIRKTLMVQVFSAILELPVL